MQIRKAIATLLVAVGILLLVTGGDQKTARWLLILGMFYTFAILAAEQRNRKP